MHGSIYEQYMWRKWVLSKKGTEEEETSRRIGARLLLLALTPNNYKSTLTHCRAFDEPTLVGKATRQLTVTSVDSYASKTI